MPGDDVNTTLRNVRLSALAGTLTATVFALLAVLAYAGGSRTFEKNGVSLSGVLLAYYTSGVVGGATVGLLLPLARTIIGTVLLGVIGSAILMISVQSARNGAFWGWSRSTFIDTAILSAIFGVVLGPWIAYEARR